MKVSAGFDGAIHAHRAFLDHLFRMAAAFAKAAGFEKFAQFDRSTLDFEFHAGSITLNVVSRQSSVVSKNGLIKKRPYFFNGYLLTDG